MLNSSYFTDNIFKYILLIENACILIQIQFQSKKSNW